MSKNNRFRINGLSRDPGSMNFGTLLKRHPKYGLPQSHLKLELSSVFLFSFSDWDVSRKVFIGGLRGDGGTKE